MDTLCYVRALMEKNPSNDSGVFNSDAEKNGGYLYTTNAPLSAHLANRRITDAVLETVSLEGKRVLDLGCGDGTYTLELFERGKPSAMSGIDIAAGAIDIALRKKPGSPVVFKVCSADRLPFADDSFDLVHLRGVLHHLDNPVDVLREALRVAPNLVVTESNGYNPVSKVLQVVSRYHRAHHEKSYSPASLRRWIKKLGGTIRCDKYVSLVPFFCPDLLARSASMMEPLVEKIPLLNALSCGVYVVVAERKARGAR